MCAASVLHSGASVGLEFSSTPEQVSVVELFTSEGCSSCPPADRWLSSLKQDPDLWHRFVPLAFHVDYWDYIGWRDRFASPQCSARQRSYARRGGVSTVYTPGFIVNGREWRGWFHGAKQPESNTKIGTLTVVNENDSVTVSFSPVDDRGRYDANVALLGANLASEITAGENHGRQLKHDFVVLRQQQFELSPDGGNHTGRIELEGPDDGPEPAAIAAWVTEHGRLTPLQATGAWLSQD